ncbi:MAG: hypothetical protein AMXMBFR58_30860 [Phycisphaerae bacterium]
MPIQSYVDTPRTSTCLEGSNRMSIAKGLIYSAIGAAIASAAWVGLIRATDFSLWIFAPVVGGAAGYGMMRATRMRGGIAAGAVAAVIALAGIFGVRYYVASTTVDEYLTVTEEDALETIASEVATELEEQDISPYDDEGDYISTVYETAEQRWAALGESEQHEFLAALESESQPESTAAVLTPLALLFDFGIFGTIFAALAAGTAFKTASMTLEQALMQKGFDAEEAQRQAAAMRNEDQPAAASGFSRIPPPSAVPSPAPVGFNADRSRTDRPAPLSFPPSAPAGRPDRGSDSRAA